MHESQRTNPFINRQPLKGGGREPFMARIRKALERKPGETFTHFEEAPTRNESLIRQVPADTPPAALLERWLEKAATNGMKVQKTPAATITQAIDSCLADHSITRSILNAGELAERFGLAKYLAGKNIEVLPWGAPDCRNLAFQCDASITDCRAAMADAGSLLVWSDTGFGRSSTLVVPVHIVLLPASRILADLIDGLEMAAKENTDRQDQLTLPSNVVVINGPSKTADIEMNLITGVHGPKFLYVIVIEDL